MYHMLYHSVPYSQTAVYPWNHSPSMSSPPATTASSGIRRSLGSDYSAGGSCRSPRGPADSSRYTKSSGELQWGVPGGIGYDIQQLSLFDS